MDRPMQQDFGDQIEAGMDRALSEGRAAEDGIDEVITEAAMLASQGRRGGNLSKHDAELAREMQRSAPPQDRPMFFPHFRKVFDWEAQKLQSSEGEKSRPSDGAAQPAPEHFFSKKTWDDVYGIRKETRELATSLSLPRPSRIQNMCFYDVSQCRSTVIADQAGSGKTLSYLLPLLQRHVFGAAEPRRPSERLKLLILAPTSDLAEQIMSVARTVSAMSSQRFRVHCATARGRMYDQRKQIMNGTDVLIATAGRLRHMITDPDNPMDHLSSCKAVVLDEVDVLVRDEADLGVEDLRKALPSSVQWVFVTATLTEVAQQQLGAFEETLKPVDEAAVRPSLRGKLGLAWHTGAGLHRVSPKCEHVIVDCTPQKLYEMSPDHRLRAVMRQKVLALCWHLRQGVLRDVQDNRLVVFCNTISNCQFVENELRKMDPRDRRTGGRAWKVLVLHGKRQWDDYKWLAEEFTTERPNARDFFKKRILVCTDRLSRGMDFSRQPVSWVVLLDWPRDATEYLRRVGRTARGGSRGGVLSFPSGLRELRMAKEVTAAAIQGLPLQGRSLDLETKAYCLERFDARYENWRSREAAAPRPQRLEVSEEEWQEEDEEDDRDARDGSQEWRRAQGWDDVAGFRPWADNGANRDGDDYDDRGDYDRDDYNSFEDDLSLDSAGISLHE